MYRYAEIRQRSLAVILKFYAQDSVNIRGYHIVKDFFRSRLPRNLGIRHTHPADE